MTILISLKDTTFRLGSRAILPNTNWEIHKGEHWAIIGPNGSGKSTLVKALWGGVSVKAGKIDFCLVPNQYKNLYEKLRQKIGYVSFELTNEIVIQERRKAEAREYRGSIHEYTSVEEVIGGGKENRIEIAKMLSIVHLLNEDITTLSTGEFRKMILARALVKNPEILILDEPFDGLDNDSRANLKAIISRLIKNNTATIIIVTHNFDEINDEIRNVILLKSGRMFAVGTRESVLTIGNISKLFYKKQNGDLVVGQAKQLEGEVLRMRNVTIKYGDNSIQSNFNWTINSGEKWALTGPNGSGKSSLVKMIIGDNPQAYANDIWVFGKKRGTGESIWDIKKQIGYASSDIQLNHHQNTTGIEVIVSGFFDSFGLYQRGSNKQIESAERLASKLDICQLLSKRYLDCSNGQKRMLILARALIKNPRLIILDEPTHGLDFSNKKKILTIINKICSSNTTLILVTHLQDEILPGINNVITLSKSDRMNYV